VNSCTYSSAIPGKVVQEITLLTCIRKV
jgi:hypothetical protein